MPSRLSRFTDRLVTLAKRAVSGNPAPPVKKVLTRNLNRLQIVTADKGYDWDDLREELREADVRPLIKHREFHPLDMAHNARHNDNIYHRRSVVEAVFFALKQRYGDTLRARTGFGQFRDLVLKAAVRNVELAS
jgi:IS5 family transposase